jgi:osmotically-inducible protein OsmY
LGGEAEVESYDFSGQTRLEEMSEEDEEIWDSLNRALAGDPRTTDALVTVRVQQGQVILRGETQAPETRTAAEDVVWGIPGVHSVVNQIVLRLPSRRR